MHILYYKTHQNARLIHIFGGKLSKNMHFDKEITKNS